jgi:hypothetical protein
VALLEMMFVLDCVEETEKVGLTVTDRVVLDVPLVGVTDRSVLLPSIELDAVGEDVSDVVGVTLDVVLSECDTVGDWVMVPVMLIPSIELDEVGEDDTDGSV